MVLVWLGSAKDSEGIKTWTWQERMDQFSFDVFRDHFLEEICNVDYWNRVWIVQEIGKARRIKIHYGSTVVDWETFIGAIRKNYLLRDCLPIKLADQML